MITESKAKPGPVPQLDNAVTARSNALDSPDGDTSSWCRVKAVWVLVGSTGATSAVQRFLNGFTNTPPIAFIYAQHYDPRRQEQLHQLTAENPLFSLEVAETSHRLAPGRILIIPPRHKVVINDFGGIASSSDQWGNAYTPNFDELFEILAGATRLPSPGVIVFSGMGRDGSASLDLLDAAGVRIWVQDPATAICAGMPRSAIASGRVHRSASPEALAEALTLLYS